MDVKDRKMMRALTIIFFGISLLILVGCQPEPLKGALRIDTIPPDVPLTIDGNFVGNSPAGAGQYFAIQLPEGEHVISALVDVDKEKQLFFEKKVFVAPDTLQTMTLKLEERLTLLGEQEKIRRDAKEAEQKRLMEIERKKKAAVLAERERKFGHLDFLNQHISKSEVNRYGTHFEIEYQIKNCSLTCILWEAQNGNRISDHKYRRKFTLKLSDIYLVKEDYDGRYAECTGGKKCVNSYSKYMQVGAMIAYKNDASHKVVSSLERAIRECSN